MKTDIKKMAVTGVFLALGTALSMVKIFNLPLGGSITLLSMLPIAMISIAYGLKWGFIGSFLYSLIQLGLGIGMDGLLGWGLTSTVLVACIFFDYIFAFTAIGFSGIFRKKGVVGQAIGIFIALTLRFACHLFSGTVLFASWMPETFDSPFVYSVMYNGSYMFPEIVFTMIAAVLLFKSSAIKKLLSAEEV